MTGATATEFVMVRHGETDWNRAQRLQGHADIPLNALGHEQAKKLAQALEKAHFDAFYTSDLSRAQQTVQPVAASRGGQITVLPELRERHYGVFEGVAQTELPLRFPQAYAGWSARHAHADLPGGESLATFFERVRRIMQKLASLHPQQRVFIATHSGVLDCAYRLATEAALEAPRTWLLLHTTINVIRWDGKRFVLVDWGVPVG